MVDSRKVETLCILQPENVIAGGDCLVEVADLSSLLESEEEVVV